MKQIKFKDITENKIHAGIVLDTEDILCLCCGSIIEKDEFDDPESYEVLEEYDKWVDPGDYIIAANILSEEN